MICDNMGLLRFTLRKIKCEFIEPRAPNNFMTTTCRIVVIKIVDWRELNFTSIYCLSGLVHKQCFAINDDSIFRTFKRQVCLVVLLLSSSFCASASALRVCLSGIKYWFSITPTPARRSSSIAPFLSPFAIFSLAIFIAASFSGVAT